MPVNLLTTAKLKTVAEVDAGSILNDGGGLRGRVRKDRAGNIHVQFEYKYRAGDKYRTAKVDNWPTSSLAEIRATCREMKAALARGIDPLEARQAAKLEAKLEQARRLEHQNQELRRLAAEEAARRTFSAAVEDWARLELSRRKDGGKEAKRALKKDVLNTLGDVALVDVTRAMLVDTLDTVVERGARVMANHLLGELRQFYNFALTRDWVQTHPLAGVTKDKVGGRQRERDRYLTEEEIIELRRQLPDAHLLKSTELAIWLMLGTCCRVGELIQARWANISIENREWLIPSANAKNAREHRVFLSDFAVAKFNSLKELSGDADWCLPARDPKHHLHLKSISKQIKDRMRLEPLKNRSKSVGSLVLSGGPWTPHDLRRTAATLMGELGVAGDVIERCLNHVEPNKLRRIYQRQELRNEQQQAWKQLGARLDALDEIAAGDNVTLGAFPRERRSSHDKC
jgi:integrase